MLDVQTTTIRTVLARDMAVRFPSDPDSYPKELPLYGITYVVWYYLQDENGKIRGAIYHAQGGFEYLLRVKRCAGDA